MHSPWGQVLWQQRGTPPRSWSLKRVNVQGTKSSPFYFPRRASVGRTLLYPTSTALALAPVTSHGDSSSSQGGPLPRFTLPSPRGHFPP